MGGRFADKAKLAGVNLSAEIDQKRIALQPNDTISGFFKRTGISAQDLMKANNITDPKDFKAGSTLKRPTAPPSPKPAPAHTTPEQKGGSLLDGKSDTQDVAQAPSPETPAKAATHEFTPERENMAKAVTQPVDPVEHIL